MEVKNKENEEAKRIKKNKNKELKQVFIKGDAFFDRHMDQKRILDRHIVNMDQKGRRIQLFILS